VSTRSAQLVAAGLSFLLVMLVGAVVFVILTRPTPGPRATATPTAVSAATLTPAPVVTGTPIVALTETPELILTPLPTATPLITATPEITPEVTFTPEITPEVTFTPEVTSTPEVTFTPEITPEITPEPTPTIEITPEPTPTIEITPEPTPTLEPSSTERQFRLNGLGLDNNRSDVAIERFVLFHQDGPGMIRVTLSAATDRTRLCLWEGNLVAQKECRTIKNGLFEHYVADPARTFWTLTLIGANASTVLDVAIDYYADEPVVTVENLRYQGVPQPNYNGVSVEMDVGAGQVQIDGTFDAGQSHAHRVVIEQASEGTIYDETGPAEHHFAVTLTADAPAGLRITISNPSETAEAAPIFLEARFAWP
jgi:hypothetical protein